MKHFILPFILAFTVSGCAALQSAEERAARVVNTYCNTATQAERQVFRTRVNQALSEQGHSIAITCSGDE